MKRGMIRKIAALLLILSMIIPFESVSFADEQEAPERGSGFFALSVIYDGEYIIAPEKIFYAEGETVRDALIASPHMFTGIDTGGFITSVDGEGESFSLFYDDMAYDLDVPAGSVGTALFMTNAGETAYSPEALSLIKALAVHPDLSDEEKAFPAVKEAYEAAYEGLKTCDGEGAAPLLSALTAAYDEYEAWAATGDVRVTFDATLGGEPVEDAVIRAKDAYGYEYVSDEGESFLDLRPGDYEFTVTKDNRVVQGSITVSAGGAQDPVSAPLPEGTWLSDISVRSATGAASPVLTVADGENEYTRDIFIPDDIDSFYPYMTLGAGDGTSGSAAQYEPYFYSDLGRTAKRTWSSYSTSVSGLFTMGCVNSRVTLEVVHATEGGLTQKQLFHFDLRRVPSVKSLTVTEDNGNSPALGFDRYTKDYTVDVISDHLTVRASCEYRDDGKLKGTPADGYKLYIDGEDVSAAREKRTEVSDGSIITVRSEGPNGETDEYHINVNLVASAQAVIEHPEGTEVSLISSSGSAITPDSDDGRTAVFSAAPGEYKWDTSLDTYYHASGSFTLTSDGANVTAASPVKEVLLSDLALKAGVPANAKVYEQAGGFDPGNHEVICLVPDTAGAFYVFPTLESGVNALRSGYTDMSGKYRVEAQITGKYSNCPQFITYGGRNNSLILRVSRASSNVTYYQDYVISTSRVASLTTLSATLPSGTAVTLYRSAEGEGAVSNVFDPDILTYYVKVPKPTEDLLLSASINASGARSSEYTVSLGGETLSSLENGNAFSFDAALDTEALIEDLRITVSLPEEENVDSVYSIKVIKLPPVYLTVNVTPEDALVSLMDDTTGERIHPGDDGRFELLPGTDYTCSITRNGYVGVTREINLSEDAVIDVALVPAEENSGLNTDLSEEWPRFRFDANNNGVTNYPLPVDREKTTIYWANKIGEGYGAQATGCPIMAGGYLYTYASRSIVKIDPMTGKAVASGEMAAGSSFAINSPTYADGMIFVALSNGRIQAFNAETLESLWLYKDPLGGQPNCPISYCDGYIYTGFWVSETKKANFVCVPTTDEDPSTGTELKTACWTVKDNGFYWAGAYVGPAGYGGGEGGGMTYILVGTDDGDSGYTTAGGNLLSVDKGSGAVIDRIDSVCTGDIRSSICYDAATDRFFFTSKGGYFCSIKINEDGTFDRESLRSIYLTNGSGNPSTPPMSTSTPCVYNGRAYIGVSGTGAYSAYTGHNITVIDIESNAIAYTVPTQGYPQTSGLVTTAYSGDDGSVYVYFIDNYTPGVLRVIKDKPGQTAPDRLVTETDSRGVEHEVAYCLFSPYGAQAQYAICSPIADEYGNIYFKNDSAYMMMVGPTIERLDVTSMPDKTEYEAGDVFDPKGLEITAVYSNGTSRIIPSEYLSVPQDPLTSDDIEINIRLDLGEHMVTYQDKNGKPGTVYDPPMATVPIVVSGSGGEVEAGIVRLFGSSRYDTAIAAADHLMERRKLESFDALIVASGTDFPDALSASYLAYKKDAPILLVGKDNVSIGKVTDYINGKLSETGKVYIVGGEGAVPASVVERITKGEVIRLAGSNRYMTNIEVLREAGIDGEELIVASGTGFADALSASAAARPILLVSGSSLSSVQRDFITENSGSIGSIIYIAGGTGAVSQGVEDQLAAFGEVKRFSGVNRYDTSIKIALEFFGGDLDTIVIASGKGFPDGLSGGPCAIYYDAPLLLVTEGYTDNPRALFVNSKAYRLVVMGGTGAVSKAVAETIAYPATE